VCQPVATPRIVALLQSGEDKEIKRPHESIARGPLGHRRIPQRLARIQQNEQKETWHPTDDEPTSGESRYGEDRWITLGLDAHGQLLVVSHTWSEAGEKSARCRIISARKATKTETRQYGVR
jgi:uncharacterized DUF497 family protein